MGTVRMYYFISSNFALKREMTNFTANTGNEIEGGGGGQTLFRGFFAVLLRREKM